MTRQDFQEIISRRHTMHTSYDFGKYNEEASCLVDAVRRLTEQNSKLPNMAELDYYSSEDSPMCEKCEEEGYNPDCESCKELEQEWISDARDENNNKIEKWLAECERVLGMEEDEICPSGMARIRFAENNRI